MTIEEKIYMVDCLLYDVRLNWDTDPRPRVKKVIELCDELINDFNLSPDTFAFKFFARQFSILIEQCKTYIDDYENYDGKYFRDTFPFGYDGLETLSGLSNNVFDKSEEFKNMADKYITCQRAIFDDLEK